MFAYISTENGIWRQSIQRVAGDQQAIFFRVVDDDGTAIDYSGANAATLDCVYHNGDVIISAQTMTEVSGSVLSYTPDAGERAKMFRPGLYRFKIKSTISSVPEYTWNLVSLRLVDV